MGVSTLNQKLICKKIYEDIYVDGNADKKIWNNIEPVYLCDNVTGEKPVQDTWVKTAWNDDFLYVIFNCKDNFPNASKIQFNDRLYEEDVVEIFIDDDSDYKTYIEVEVNPLNALLHYFVLNDLKGKINTYARCEKKIITAVKLDDLNKAWSAEIAIPMLEFVTSNSIPPKQGDLFKVNFYRIDKDKKGSFEYTAWSPTGKINYHMPVKFGVLEFRDGK